MITARLNLQDNGAHALLVQGHAGYARPGHDIVCAAVSTVVALSKITMEKYGCTHLMLDDEDGVILLGEGEDAGNILTVAIKVMQMLAVDFPKHVRVIDSRTGDVIPGSSVEHAL